MKSEHFQDRSRNRHKDVKTILVEYISSLSDDDLCFLGTRLIDRYAGDLGQVLNFMSKKSQIDMILSSAVTAFDLYQLCDLIQEMGVKEAKKRKLNLYGDRS